MVLGRSHWELPEHLLAQVHQPRIDELRAWDPERVEDKYGDSDSLRDDDELRRRREEAIARTKQQSGEEQDRAERDLSLQQRMALAAQRKKQEELEVKTAAGGVASIGAQQGEEGKAQQSSEYLEMVRKLQHVDRNTEETGSKWLVR